MPGSQYASKPALKGSTPSSSSSAAGHLNSGGHWAAKKIHSNGKEIRYWVPGAGAGASARRAGWYGRDFRGGWDDASTPLISAASLNPSEAGVELLSRVDEPSRPSSQLAVVEEQTDFFAHGAGRARSRGAVVSMPQQLQVERFSELVG